MPLNIKGTMGCCRSETVLKVENFIIQFYHYFCWDIFFSVRWTVVAISNKKFSGKINRKRVFFFFFALNFQKPQVLSVDHLMQMLLRFTEFLYCSRIFSSVTMLNNLCSWPNTITIMKLWGIGGVWNAPYKILLQ